MRLEITRKSELALRAVRELAGAPESRKGEALAAAIGTTPSFLAQALTPLVRARWLRSDPGPRGGYRLARPADELSVLELIEAIEGPTANGRCVLSRGDCAEVTRSGAPCALHDAWTTARVSLLGALARQPALRGSRRRTSSRRTTDRER